MVALTMVVPVRLLFTKTKQCSAATLPFISMYSVASFLIQLQNQAKAFHPDTAVIHIRTLFVKFSCPLQQQRKWQDTSSVSVFLSLEWPDNKPIYAINRAKNEDVRNTCDRSGAESRCTFLSPLSFVPFMCPVMVSVTTNKGETCTKALQLKLNLTKWWPHSNYFVKLSSS